MTRILSLTLALGLFITGCAPLHHSHRGCPMAGCGMSGCPMAKSCCESCACPHCSKKMEASCPMKEKTGSCPMKESCPMAQKGAGHDHGGKHGG